jgi:hypothetical protein
VDATKRKRKWNRQEHHQGQEGSLAITWRRYCCRNYFRCVQMKVSH